MDQNEMRIPGEGVELALREWIPAGEVRGVVVLSHGLGEHVGRYGHVAEALGTEGWVLTGADHRGHGRSGGLRGHVDGFGQYAADLDRVVARAAAQWPGKPIFLYGHSMGGLIALVYLLEGRGAALRGAIVSNPPFRLAFEPPKLKVLAGRLLARFVPKLRLGNELSPDDLSRDRTVVEAYRADPYVHGYISTRWFTSQTAAAEDALARIEELRQPILWVVSGKDPICSAQATREAAGRSPAGRLFELPDALHEPHNELDKADLFAAMKEWLRTRID